ncbi:cytochrome b/b6 domain-containing protein [Primorskyibacter sp. 2E107]|uniref:cytochrome b/b6 domain-containing protein n=1 Tax=Primorskyibacter sp. 2E107 TaxID=3403458 RepID=UPI003AF682F9
MALQNTSTRFGSLSKALHWAIALGILLMIPLGVIASDAPYGTAEELAWKAQLFSAHKTVGVVLFGLALIRIAWMITQPKPAPLHPERKLETWLGETVHWVLYGALVLVPLTGWIHHAATTGFAPIWWPFGQSLPFVPKDEVVAGLFGGMHVIAKNVLIASLLLHIAGALKHHFVDRDATLRRMLPGRAEAGVPGAGSHGFAAIVAVAVWAGALGFALLPGGSQAEGGGPALAQVESEWTVRDGTLGLAVQQMGSTVNGSFSDWQAAISFAGPEADAPQGEVRVEVAIPSLTLGSVTKQALGADYFNAEAYPTAVYTGEIFAVEGGYKLRGALDLKGTQVPLTMDFTLDLDGDTAMAKGEGTLDRRDFGIGESMTDPGQLGFEVLVSFELTAVRGTAE